MRSEIVSSSTPRSTSGKSAMMTTYSFSPTASVVWNPSLAAASEPPAGELLETGVEGGAVSVLVRRLQEIRPVTTIQTLINEEDVRNFTSYVDGMGRRASRDQLLPILKKHFEPVVAAERQFLSGHSRSGALMTSLVARTGAGDKPGTMSVFSAPTATTKQLQKTWGSGRSQQRKWAARLLKKGRRRIFYGPIVHQGHRIVLRNRKGQLVDTGRKTAPVPFAQYAMDTVGDKQAELAANAIMDHVLGKE